MFEKGKYDNHPLYAALRKKKIPLKSFCLRNDIGYQTLLAILHGTRNPSFSMLLKILSSEGAENVDPNDFFAWHWKKYLEKAHTE